MDPAEEQAGELEALEAIFDSDFRLKEPATESSGARFEIDLADLSSDDVKVRLVFTHPPSYPEVPIQLVVYALEGISTPRRQKLQTHLNNVAQENIGMPSAWSVYQAAQEWIEEKVIGTVEKEEDEDTKFETLDATEQDKVEVISSKAVGTPVTVESFASWREKFMEEVRASKTQEQLEKESITKLTGREFFESKTVVVSAESESFWEQEVSHMAAK